MGWMQSLKCNSDHSFTIFKYDFLCGIFSTCIVVFNDSKILPFLSHFSILIL